MTTSLKNREAYEYVLFDSGTLVGRGGYQFVREAYRQRRAAYKPQFRDKVEMFRLVRMPS